MKLFLTLALVTLLALPAIAHDHDIIVGYGDDEDISYDISRHAFTIQGITIDFDDDLLILDHEAYRGEMVEFTPDHELYINGDQVSLNADQKMMVKDFYNGMNFVFKETKAIGVEGIKIGLNGAQIGMSAIGGLFKMLLTNYDEDDFERDMEHRADKIEDRAELLERRADRLEGAVDDVTRLSSEMFEAIPELQQVEWLSD